MKAELLLYIGGVFHLAWVVFDSFWPKLFRWKETLASLDDFHRILLPLITKLIIVVYLTFAYLSFFHTADLLNTELGTTILLFIVIYWIVRAIEQIYYFGFDKANGFSVSFSSFAPFFPFDKMSNKAISYYFFTVFILMIMLYAIPLFDKKVV